MRNVLKGRNFHNRRSTTCGNALHSFFCLKGSTCPAVDCVDFQFRQPHCCVRPPFRRSATGGYENQVL
ncbi:MAG: hypothetical protein LBF89_03810 [Bacteroidales bacterium]|nr:hypothetical protein [Bacteroidales bacterium]